MTAAEYLSEINAILDGEGAGLVFPDAERPWGIEWHNCADDAFTGNAPVSTYWTPAEALAAARAIGDPNNYEPHNPLHYPAVREAVERPSAADLA